MNNTSSDLFAQVKAIPIESVIQEYFPSLEIKHSARDVIAHCPFHDEKTPSFRVYVERNRWHCFGACGAGGSSVDLLMRAKLASTALEAARALATKFSIPTGNEKAKRKSKALTVAEYAAFCALPETFLVE